jgi:hypothetical protein
VTVAFAIVGLVIRLAGIPAIMAMGLFMSQIGRRYRWEKIPTGRRRFTFRQRASLERFPLVNDGA